MCCANLEWEYFVIYFFALVVTTSLQPFQFSVLIFRSLTSSEHCTTLSSGPAMAAISVHSQRVNDFFVLLCF